MSDNTTVNQTVDGMTHEHTNGTNPKKQISSWNGDRPFKGGIYAYELFMRRKLEGCMKYLRANKEHVCAQVRVQPNQELEIQLDDGTFTSYKFHVVHYGPLVRNDEQHHWMSRYNIFDRLQVFPPFRTLQVEMLNKGFYLMDESDPTKSKRMIIRLYKNRPLYPMYLWHTYGVIPMLGAVATGVTTVPASTEFPSLNSTVPTSTELPVLDSAVPNGPFMSYISALSQNSEDDGAVDEKGDN